MDDSSDGWPALVPVGVNKLLHSPGVANVDTGDVDCNAESLEFLHAGNGVKLRIRASGGSTRSVAATRFDP